MMNMEVVFGLWCLVYCFLAVSCDDATIDPNRIPGVVTKPDNSDVTVGIALGVGAFLLLVAFLIVVIINKCKKRKEGNRETVLEDGQSTTYYANGNNNSDNKNLIPLHDVNTISVQDAEPNTENQTVVRENVEEVNSALVTSDISRHDHQADAQDRVEDVHSAAVTELEEPRQESNQSEARNTNSLVSVAAVGGAVVGGASLIGGASILNSNDSDPELQTRIEDTIDNEVIDNVPENLEQEISDNQFVSSAFVVGADHDSDHNSDHDSEFMKESERAFEDAQDSDIPATPPPSVDYLETVEHELAEEVHDNEFPNPPDGISTEDDAREFFEDRVIADHSQIDDADDFQPNNTVDSDSYSNTDQVDYDRDLGDEEPTLPSETTSVQEAAYNYQADDRDLSDEEPTLPSETTSVQAADYDHQVDARDLSDEEPTLPSDHHESTSVPASDYDHQANARDQVKHAPTKVTTFSADSSQSEYLRSFAPPPLDMDHIIIISKD